MWSSARTRSRLRSRTISTPGRPAQVAALREKREKAAATFSAYVAEIDASISKLLAIE